MDRTTTVKAERKKRTILSIVSTQEKCEISEIHFNIDKYYCVFLLCLKAILQCNNLCTTEENWRLNKIIYYVHQLINKNKTL